MFTKVSFFQAQIGIHQYKRMEKEGCLVDLSMGDG
jgi:hypothetical protein